MKKIVTIGVAAIACMVMAGVNAMSLADARGQIGGALEGGPEKVGELAAQLEAADQVAFLAEVNAAIGAMPGSVEEKTAKYVDANEAVLKASKKGNLQALLAETFATVPPEALTLVNERLAADLFSRSANPTMPDDEFTNRVFATMEVIQSRTATADDAAVRNTFAVLMCLHASEGSPADLRDRLIDNLPDESSRELARNEWVPAAMGEGQDKTYESMLGASDAGRAPDNGLVLRVAGPAIMSSMLSDLGSTTSSSMSDSSFSIDSLGMPEATESSGLTRAPLTDDPTQPYFPGSKRGEPSGYQLQNY